MSSTAKTSATGATPLPNSEIASPRRRYRPFPSDRFEAVPTLEELEAIARGGAPPPPLDAADRERLAAGRAVVEEAIAAGKAIYGVTTGFGQLADVHIAP